MKIGEQWFLDGKTLHQKKTYDPNPSLQRAQSLRESGAGAPRNQNQALGVVPTWLWFEWAKQAGLDPSDPAMGEVAERKLQEREFSQFRTYEGNF